ncbi:MAG: hypothetical protein M1834_001366 [Cirrosporium novae-zelandiae]|nr:MAG: hypothetical protein M1834_001366 [Cirrosporium novae-zelandiae]
MAGSKNDKGLSNTEPPMTSPGSIEYNESLELLSEPPSEGNCLESGQLNVRGKATKRGFWLEWDRRNIGIHGSSKR